MLDIARQSACTYLLSSAYNLKAVLSVNGPLSVAVFASFREHSPMWIYTFTHVCSAFLSKKVNNKTYSLAFLVIVQYASHVSKGNLQLFKEFDYIFILT